MSPPARLAVLALCATAAAEADWLDDAITTAFDPAWNVANSAIIWTTIITVLLLSGVGFPLPEDIPLTLAGFTTYKQDGDQFLLASFVATFVVVTVPILLGDVIAYWLGRKYGFGPRARFRFVARVVSAKRIERAQRWFDQYGSFTILLARQVAGIRFVTFFMAGTMRVRLRNFVAFDFLGCLLSVPVWLTLGALASRYGEEWLHTTVRKVGGGFILLALLAFGVLVLVAVRRKATTQRTVDVAKPEP